jgi:hypothetical protein
VIDRLRAFLTNRGELLDAINDEVDDHVGRKPLIERARQLADELGSRPETTKTVLMALIGRVEVRPDCVKIDVSHSRLAALLASASVDLPIQHQDKTDGSDRNLALMAPVHLKRVGREMKLLVDDPGDNRAPDMGLLRIVARAHDFQTRLAEDTNLTVHDVASEEGVTAAYIYVLLRLRWLAPDITTAIVNGRQPLQLNAKKLMRLTAQLPGDWAEQRALLGFR